ncbi:MAG: FtsX-like permease family protein [Bacteroidales bacterium]
MNFPLFIAKRYLVAKKGQNVINIISNIAMVGVTVGTMALIVVLSVFNGFEGLVKSLYNSFDPDLKITPVQGKTFIPRGDSFGKALSLPGIAYSSEVIEDNALIRYDEKQYIATIKGVDNNFVHVSGVDSMIHEGEFNLYKGNKHQAVIGQGVAYFLSVGLNFVSPLVMYVPRRTERVLDPKTAFNREYIFPSGIFRIEQEYDSRYVLVPLEFSRTLFGYANGEVSAIEISLYSGTSSETIQEKLRNILGPSFEVKNRFQQKELFYKIMKSEKWAIFFILSFILIVASFNIIGSLTMLIIDKKKDIASLRSLGSDINMIRRIFLFEGLLITISGTVMGLLLGGLISWLQMEFGFIRLQGSGSFVVEAYPVQMKLTDFILVFFTVIFIGFIASWYPIRFISRKYFMDRFAY